MCSFGSCKTRFELLSQFRKVRNAFECFITQVQTHLPKTKRVWPMKINVICTVRVAELCESIKLITVAGKHTHQYVVLGCDSDNFQHIRLCNTLMSISYFFKY